MISNFSFWTKFIFVVASCSGLAFLSVKWSKIENLEGISKVSLSNKENKLKEIKRIEDIDIWGKQHGCSFIFVKDWDNREIYTATGYAKAKGGKSKKLTTIDGTKDWERIIIDAVNEYKTVCGHKLKTFTFLWSGAQSKFYIGNPNEKPKFNQRYFGNI